MSSKGAGGGAAGFQWWVSWFWLGFMRSGCSVGSCSQDKYSTHMTRLETHNPHPLVTPWCLTPWAGRGIGTRIK